MFRLLPLVPQRHPIELRRESGEPIERLHSVDPFAAGLDNAKKIRRLEDNQKA
jgi:hypothetical protein